MNMYLPPEHPIIAIWNNRNQNSHRICKTVYFEISRVVFIPNITHDSCYYLFILQPEKFSHLTPCLYFRGVVSLRRRVNWFRSSFFRPSWSRHSNNHSNHVISHLSDWLYQVHKAKPKHFRWASGSMMTSKPDKLTSTRWLPKMLENCWCSFWGVMVEEWTVIGSWIE